MATARPRARAGGKRDADRTRERIVQAAVAAIAAFAARGRLGGICRRARANPRMVYAHFGDKHRPYLSVLEHVRGELRPEEPKREVGQVDRHAALLQPFEFVDHQSWQAQHKKTALELPAAFLRP